MSGESNESVVEISIGDNQLRMEGTEEFISNQLSEVLDRVDLSAQSESQTVDDSAPKSGGTDPQPGESSSSEDEEEESRAGEEDETGEDKPALHKVAQRLEVEPEQLAEHFYVDEDGIHIQSPLDIEPKYAVLGYCTLEEILNDQIYHGNKETKDKLIDIEKVDIGRWGRDLLPSLRDQGLIKDNPNVDKDRNIPFKITPSGRRELVEWLNENS